MSNGGNNFDFGGQNIDVKGKGVQINQGDNRGVSQTNNMGNETEFDPKQFFQDLAKQAEEQNLEWEQETPSEIKEEFESPKVMLSAVADIEDVPNDSHEVEEQKTSLWGKVSAALPYVAKGTLKIAKVANAINPNTLLAAVAEQFIEAGEKMLDKES